MVLACVPSLAWAVDFDSIVIVSIDALHPDALTEKNAPLTMAFLEKGSLTRKGNSTTPPKTLIAHSAMLTGRGPQQGGMSSNDWTTGDPTVEGETIFHMAKKLGYRIGFFYSKPKLGFLVNDAVDMADLSPDDSISRGVRFLKAGGHDFVFIHVSGLDVVGPQHGWMSSEYLEELSYIDQYLEELYVSLAESGKYLLILTSDHAGYGKSHGGTHPDEARLPFGVVSDTCLFPKVAGTLYRVTDLPLFLQQAMGCTPVQ